MKAFFVAQLNVKKPDLFKKYAEGAAESMKPFGGKVITKGKLSEELAGESAYQNIAIVGFPDKENLEKWYVSESYQKLIPLRDDASDMLLISFDVAL